MPIELSDLTPEALDELTERVAARVRQLEPGEAWPADKLAAKLGCDVSTVSRMVSSGRLRRVPGTHRLLIPECEALRVLNGEEAA